MHSNPCWSESSASLFTIKQRQLQYVHHSCSALWDMHTMIWLFESEWRTSDTLVSSLIKWILDSWHEMSCDISFDMWADQMLWFWGFNEFESQALRFTAARSQSKSATEIWHQCAGHHRHYPRHQMRGIVQAFRRLKRTQVAQHKQINWGILWLIAVADSKEPKVKSVC